MRLLVRRPRQCATCVPPGKGATQKELLSALSPQVTSSLGGWGLWPLMMIFWMCPCGYYGYGGGYHSGYTKTYHSGGGSTIFGTCLTICFLACVF